MMFQNFGEKNLKKKENQIRIPGDGCEGGNAAVGCGGATATVGASATPTAGVGSTLAGAEVATDAADVAIGYGILT